MTIIGFAILQSHWLSAGLIFCCSSCCYVLTILDEKNQIIMIDPELPEAEAMQGMPLSFTDFSDWFDSDKRETR